MLFTTSQERSASEIWLAFFAYKEYGVKVVVPGSPCKHYWYHRCFTSRNDCTTFLHACLVHLPGTRNRGGLGRTLGTSYGWLLCSYVASMTIPRRRKDIFAVCPLYELSGIGRRSPTAYSTRYLLVLEYSTRVLKHKIRVRNI